MCTKESLSSEEKRQKIFKKANLDWWMIDINAKIISLGENIVKDLELDTDVFPFEKTDAFLDQSKQIELFQTSQQDEKNKVIDVPLNTVKYKNKKALAYITYKDENIIEGYMRVYDQNDNIISSEIGDVVDSQLSFLANMSHELRTPLNAIVGFSRILAETDDAEEKNEYLKIILDNNDIMMQLISDILDLSKIEAGVLNVNCTDIDLYETMDEISKSVAFRMKNSAVKFSLIKPNIHSCFINTDVNRLQQVINNLLNNAIKFTSSGYIKLGYEIQDTEIYFYVEDTGIGIKTENVQNIFHRFTRLNKNVKGTGLGLEISSSIVKRLGGRIGVDSVYGKGSKFWFTLPNNLKESIELIKTDEPQVKEVDSFDTKPTILVVEDNPSNYKLCEVLLKKTCRLLHGWNGQEGVEIFKEKKPDLVLMDINMPVMDGYQATQAIRSMDWNTPIIALTAYALADDKERILNSGFDGYLSKPLDVEIFNELLAKYLRKTVK